MFYYEFQSNPSLSRITVCCQGYQRHPHIFRKCEPICANKCPNGVCVGPNECICYPEHVKNLAGFCVPVCPVGLYHLSLTSHSHCGIFVSKLIFSLIIQAVITVCATEVNVIVTEGIFSMSKQNYVCRCAILRVAEEIVLLQISVHVLMAMN